MSLQRRLTLFFIVIVMLPLLAAGLVVRYVVVGQVEKQAKLVLGPAIEATSVSYELKAESVDEVLVASSAPGTQPGIDLGRLIARRDARGLGRLLHKRLLDETGTLDFIGAVDRNSRFLAFESMPQTFSNGFSVTRNEVLDVAADSRRSVVFGEGFVSTSVFPLVEEGTGKRIGGILGGFWLDGAQLVGASRGDVELVFITGGRVVASTAGGTVPDADHTEAQREQPLNGQTELVAWAPGSPTQALSQRVFLSMLGLLLLALIPITLLAYWLAKLITQPLEEVSRGAEAVSRGRFDYQIPVDSGDEVGQLAMAFNDMTDRLRETVTELSSSRSQLQLAVQRVGETLRSTHDMRQILESILNTATDAVNADAAVLWAFTPNRAELYPAVGRGVDVQDLQRVKVGSGLVGHIAERGTTSLQPSPDGGPRASSAEPPHPVVVGIPLYSGDRIHAVMTLYRHDEARPFSRSDVETVTFLAEQGGVALENVQLHEEAQRLSITDGLTGVWNRRYFQMQFRQVLATSVRFGRTFSVLMLDLDFFKQVNDSHGHQRGDAILIEFAQRVNKLLREVDTVARYGGEEFICLLSETDVEGAQITAEKIREAVRSEPFRHAGEGPLTITVSIGVASFPVHGNSYQTLVGAADGAMYRAKQEGRDCVRVAGNPQPQQNLKLAT